MNVPYLDDTLRTSEIFGSPIFIRVEIRCYLILFSRKPVWELRFDGSDCAVHLRFGFYTTSRRRLAEEQSCIVKV